MNEDIVHGSMERDNVGKQSVEAIKSLRTTEKKLVEREKRKPGKRLDLVGSESNGLKQDKKEGRFETVKWSKSSVLETPAISSEHDLLNQKGYFHAQSSVKPTYNNRDTEDNSGSNGKLSHTVAFENRGDATNFC